MHYLDLKCGVFTTSFSPVIQMGIFFYAILLNFLLIHLLIDLPMFSVLIAGEQNSTENRKKP